MEERVKKARDIVEKIEKLRTNIKKIMNVENIRLYNHKHWLFDTSTGNLTNEMKEAYIKAAENEIGALEQKLAEL